MESAEGVRSHSWWWNSHISPKNSKWLQESMADMDSKITAMLKIIEEDADSFAQRAEMYYKKRPELINLVEDFYRAYRALAERYDSITEELRQNIRLQYALSSSDSSRKIDASIQREKELHEFDSLMVSLSESFSGLGYDEDEDSEVSSRALKQPFDDAGPFSTCMEAEGEGDNSKLLPELVQENNTRESNNKISILQQKNQQLVEENKLLKVMTSTHAGQTNNYDVHLPELQKKIKNLEDEGKQIRDRLQAAIERANILETENLKLNSLQLALEEEKAEMAVSYERSREDYQLTSKQVKDLEESLCHLRHKTSKEASAGAEKIRQLEEEAQNLQCSLLNLRQGKKEKEMELQGCIQQLLVVEKKLLDLQVTLSKLQVESSGLKCELASKTVYIEKLQKQVLEWQYLRMSLDGEESAKAAAEEKLKDKLKIAIEQVEKLEAEIQHLEQRLHSVQMMERKAKGLEEEILQLQEENNALEITRLDRTLLITKLENELQECEWQREILQNEVSSCKEQFRELQSELSVCKEQKQMLSSQLSASAVQFNKAQEGILKLHKCKSLLEEEVSMQLIIVSMQEEETFKLQEENVKLASRLQDKTKQLQEYEENRLEQQLFLRSQQDRNVELLSEKSSRTTQDHNDLLEDLKQLNVNLSKLEEENQYIKTESSVRMTLLDNIVSEVAQLNEEKHTLNFELELKVQEAAMLQNHLNKQTIETEEVKEELQAGLGKIKLLEEKILMLEQEMKKLQGENRRLAESSYRVEECYKDCEKKLDQANVEINFLRNVNVQKHVELASRVETTEKLEEEINKLLREQKILHDERLSNIKIINESKEEVRKLQEDRKQLNLVIQQKVAELQHRDTLVQLLHIRSFQTKEENESLRDLISRTSNEWTFSGNNVRQVVEELTNLKSQRMHLDDKLLERIAHEKQLAEEVCRLQIEKNILLEENASNARNLRVSKQEVCNLQEVEKFLKDSLKESEKEIKMLQLALEKLELSLSSSKQKTDELRKWIKRDVEEYTSIRNSVTEMQEDLSELEKEKSNLQFDAASAEACIFELEEMVSTLQNQKAFLEEAIKMEEAANSMLQTVAKTHLETERKLEEKLQAGAMEIMTLRNEKEVQEVESKKLLTELNRLQQGNVTLKEQCQRQQETMQIKNNIIQEMEMDILALHNVIFTVAKEETDLKDEGQINLTRKQVFDLKEELLRLKEEEKKLSANEEKHAVHIFKLEEQLFHSSEHTNVLSDRLTKSIEECTSLEGKVAKLEEDLSVMKQENTNLEGEISSCVAHVKTIEVVMFSLMHDMFCCEETGPAICSGDFLHNLKEERMLLQNNEMLKSENLNLEMHDVRENKWEERICQLQAIRNAMKAELASKLATIRHLEEEKQISQKEKTKVEELLISKEREIEILHGEISSLLEKQNVVKSFHVAAQEAQEDTLAETDQLQREIKNNEREINDFRKPMCSMQGQNSCLEAEESFCEVEKLKKGIFSNKSTQNEGELLPLQSCGDLSCTRLNNKIKEIQETEMEKQQEILPCTQKGINASSVIHNMRDKQARGVTDCHYFVEAAASSGIGKDASTDSITSHVNLGNRLHQEIMNENMQLEVHQLQLEQKKLRLRLQLWMEHKDDLLAEIEKLLDLMVSSTDKHDEEIFKEHQEFSKYSIIDSSLRDLEERILLLQERKDATSVELKFDTKERKRIRNELLVLGEQERTSLSFESWKVKACKLHDEIKRLQKRNEKQFNVFQEIEEQIGKIRIETKRVCNQMVQEHFSPSLQYYKHFSFFTNHSGKAFTWLDTTRSIKMPEGHDPGKASSAAKKLCRCCICISPDAMAEY